MARMALRPALRAYAHAPAGVEEGFENTYAFSFDGSNDYGQTSAISGIPGSGGYSISLWAKLADWTSANFLMLFSLADSTSRRVEILTGQSGYRNIFINEGSGGTRVIASPNLSADLDDTWVHFCLTATTTTSSAGVHVLYVNGTEPIGSGGGTGTPPSGLTGIDVGYIGRYKGSGLYWSGFIDEVAVYDTALTEAQVQAIYGGTPGTVSAGKALDLTGLDSDANLVHWWRLGDGEGDATTTGTVYDQEGSADMTMSGFSAPYGRVEDGPPV